MLCDGLDLAASKSFSAIFPSGYYSKKYNFDTIDAFILNLVFLIQIKSVLKSNFYIPKPCSQNWSTMTNVENGKFCELCNKKVYDLTNLNNYEIGDLLKYDNKICARIKVNNSISRLNFKKYGVAL